MKVYLVKETSRNLRNQSLALLILSLSCKRIKSHLFNLIQFDSINQ